MTRNLYWLLAVLVGIFLLGLPSILYPFHPDHAMFAYIGDRWLNGGLPYRDAWDVKPPGIFGIYAVSQLLFGRSMAAARWADLIFTLAAAVFLFLIARRNLRPVLAALAPLLFALVYFTAFDFQDSAQSESFGAAFIAAYAWLLMKAADTRGAKWLVAAGILLGCATLLKTTFILFLLMAAPSLRAVLESDSPDTRLPKRRFISEGPTLRVAIVLVGALIPIALTVGYFAAYGAAGYLGELLAAQKAYGTLPDSAGIAKAFRSTARFFRQRPEMVLLCILAAFQIIRSARARHPESRLLICWLGIGAGMIAIQWRCHSYHFLVLLPPLSLMAANTLAQAWDLSEDAESKPRPFALAATLAALLIPVALGMGRIGMAVQRSTGGLTEKQYWACFAAPGWYPFGGSALTAEFVRARTLETDKILVFDYDPAIYYLSGRIAPTRHLSSEPIIGAVFFPKSLRNRWRDEQITDVNATPPKLLVVGTCPHCCGLSNEHVFSPESVNLGENRYTLLKSISKDRIYLLADSESDGTATAEIRSRIRTTARGE